MTNHSIELLKSVFGLTRQKLNKKMLYLLWIVPICILSWRKYEEHDFGYGFLFFAILIMFTYYIEHDFLPMLLSINKKKFKSYKTKFYRLTKILFYKFIKENSTITPYGIVLKSKETRITKKKIWEDNEKIQLSTALILWLFVFNVNFYIILFVIIICLYFLYIMSKLFNTILNEFD